MNGTFILITIAVYFGLLLLVARITARHHTDNDAFFSGNHQSPWYIVSFGMIRSLPFGSDLRISAGNGRKHRHDLYADLLRILLRLSDHRPRAASALLQAQPYLDIHLSGKTFREPCLQDRSLVLPALKNAGAAARLYLVCVILQHFVFDAYDIPFSATVIGTVVLIWLYTRKSGIRTIVWTDSFQTLCLLLALGLILYQVASLLDLDAAGVIKAVSENEHSHIFVFDDWHSKQNFFKQFFSGIFITIVMTGLDQDMMQKKPFVPQPERSAKKHVLLRLLVRAGKPAVPHVRRAAAHRFIPASPDASRQRR